MFETSSKNAVEGPVTWWCELEFGVLLLLGIVTFCIRLDALPLFGEEPRRALIAREMVESGDWLVPGTQRVFLPSRPPLQNWMIAITGSLSGSFDVWSARIPSVLSTLAIGVLIYGYLRQQFGRLGSFSGAAAFLTMTLVMEFGRSAETEAVFSLFVAASMLLWHWGWIRKWSSSLMWSTGYFCAALGMLTKGLQAPLYFVGSASLFLFVIGNWRAIFTRGHLVGALVFVTVVALWQGPFTWQRGVSDSLGIYFEDVAGRFVDRNWSRFLEHLVVFPLELFCVRLMPWSIMLLTYANPRVRETLGARRETVVFLTICILFTFVTVWLPPGSKVRYYMPLFPCFAGLIGIAIDRIAALRGEPVQMNLWNNYVKLMSQLMIGSALVVVSVSLALPASRIALPTLGACGFATLALTLGVISWKSLNEPTDRAMACGVFSIATFLALVQISLVVTVQQRRCEDIAGQIERLKQQLPADAELVSLGPIHHAFAFYYHQPIPIVKLPIKPSDENFNFFCLHTYGKEPPQLPFEWTQVGVVSCDRLKGRPTPQDRVFIGRRHPSQQVGFRDLSRLVD